MYSGEIEFPSKVNMSNSDYHAQPAVGSSDLKKVLRSPAHFQYARTNRSPSTASQNFGTAVHYAILEPDLFKTMVMVQPKFSGTGAHAARDKWLTEHHGKILLSQDDFDSIPKIVKSVAAHPIAKKLLAAGMSEESYFWIDKATGVKCKCRPDYYRVGGIMVDPKTTVNASFFGFQKEIAKYDYHVSAAHYVEGVFAVTGEMPKAFIWLAIENEEPFAVATYYIDEGSLDAGRFEVRRALERLQKCYETNSYPGYSDDLVSMSIPSWKFPVGGEG